tara:strand:- start:943 stop:1425 length:483 start_codon:yes stop_codon:yes gene_type:complete
MKIIITLYLIIFFVNTFAQDSIDKIIIKKSERQLYVIKNNKVLKKYDIALGKNPIGHKQKEGDKKTPEGYYFIDGKNAKSNFFLSLHTSYPSYFDKQVAFKKNKDPGKHIAIHGLPPAFLLSQYLFDGADWTDGCIALNNSDMQELWDLTREGTTIIIEP